MPMRIGRHVSAVLFLWVAYLLVAPVLASILDPLIVEPDSSVPVPLPSCSPKDGPPEELLSSICLDTCETLCDTQCTVVCLLNQFSAPCNICRSDCLASCFDPCDECEQNSTGLVFDSGSGTPLFDPCHGHGGVTSQAVDFCLVNWYFRVGYLSAVPGLTIAYLKEWTLFYPQSGFFVKVRDGLFYCDDIGGGQPAVSITLRNSNSSIVMNWKYSKGGSVLDCQMFLRDFSSPWTLPGWNQFSSVSLMTTFMFSDAGGATAYTNAPAEGTCSNNQTRRCYANSHCGPSNKCYDSPKYLDQKCNCTGYNTVSVTQAPTPSVTPTRTPTSSSTPSNTRTPTPSITPTRTPTSTQTPTSSSTGTRTPSTSPTGTSTPTSTMTPTPSSTSTTTPTSSTTATATPTPSNSPTGSQTASRTPSQTPSELASPSITPSQTPTASATMTPSQTPSQTPTSTQTPTSSQTPTGSVTATNTPTGTQTPTRTATSTPTPTGSTTATSTPSATRTPTSTVTSSTTNTPTGSETPTPSATVTISSTGTTTPSPTVSPTTSGTQTPSSIVTMTATPEPELPSDDGDDDRTQRIIAWTLVGLLVLCVLALLLVLSKKHYWHIHTDTFIARDAQGNTLMLQDTDVTGESLLRPHAADHID